jgi:hypothetical protein
MVFVLVIKSQKNIFLKIKLALKNAGFNADFKSVEKVVKNAQNNY